MGPLLHTGRKVTWLVLLSSGHFSFSIAFQGLEWLLHAFSPDLPVVVIVSRGKALLPLPSGVARLFLVRVPNLYFGSIQYSWGTWLGSSAQREAQPDRRGLQWLPHLKYSTISGFPSDRWWWYTDIPLRCTRSPLQRWIHNHGSPQSS